MLKSKNIRLKNMAIKNKSNWLITIQEANLIITKNVNTSIKIKIIKTKLTSNKIIKKTYKRKLIFIKVKIIKRNGYESV